MSIRSWLSIGALLAAVALLSLSRAQAVPINLVQNPGFESGLASWSSLGWFGHSSIAGPPYEASGYAVTGCSALLCTLSQALPTDAGQTYDLSFAFRGTGIVREVWWDGVLLATLNSTADWLVYTYSDLLATTSSTTLRFDGKHLTGFNSLDAVSVTAAVSEVPIPIAFPLFATGLGVMGLLGWRRKRKAALAD